MEWTFVDGKPIYMQIVDILRDRVAGREYLPGEKIPSVREIAVEAGVNPNTVQKAFAELERQGLVYTDRTSGRFVTKDEAVLNKMYDELSSGYINELVTKLHNIGMTDNEIKDAVSRCIEKEKI
ncbi:MAG: GntR family transcriptional regulator [Hornefia sp.]|nr:GntR family transcriptional regulator [Hornefia sp.]